MEDVHRDQFLAPYLAFDNVDDLLDDELPCPYRPQRSVSPSSHATQQPKSPAKRRKGKK